MAEVFFNLVLLMHSKWVLEMNSAAFHSEISFLPINELGDSYSCYCNHDGITSL